MQEKPKKISIFLKILLIAIAIFIGLTLYAYKMIKDDKENSHRNSVIAVSNMPMPHPPLTQRDETNKQITDEMFNHEVNSSLEENKTRSVLEGAEYISVEEQLEREKEANLSMLQNEELSDEQIIPQDEIDNYEEAITIPMNNPSLGTPIGDTLSTPF